MNIIGIDLGTTMSVIGMLQENGEPKIIKNSDGETLTPSVIFKNNNEVMVGSKAKSSLGSEYDKGAFEFKRYMYDPNWTKEIDGKKYTAVELSSLVLKKIIKDAEESPEIDGKITDVVISVPAYFKEAERNSTILAGEKAGLNVIGLINEPTAAALYYSNYIKTNGYYLIYDLGGGTFDVTMIEKNNDDLNIITSSGDSHLGGVDFDKSMLELIKEKYEEETGGLLYEDLEDEYSYLLIAEDYKKQLSGHEKIMIKIVGDSGRAKLEITSKEYNKKIIDLIQLTELKLEEVIKDTRKEVKSDFIIEEIFLTGGSSRMNFVKDSIKKTTGKEPISKSNLDEAVALGATIKAGLIQIKNNPEKVPVHIKHELKNKKIQDVANHSYGTEVINNGAYVNSIIIKKNTPIPCEESKIYYTNYINQTSIGTVITQGESTNIDFVNIIENVYMELPFGRPAGMPIKVTFSYDENQVMSCLFEDIQSGKKELIKTSVDYFENSSNDLDDIEII